MKFSKAGLDSEFTTAKGSVWWPEQVRRREASRRHIDGRMTESQRAGSDQHNESYVQANWKGNI